MLRIMRYLFLLVIFLITSANSAYAQGQAPPGQTETLQQLSPEQRSAVEAEINKTGGVLTPETIKSLKERPEFQGLTPEEIIKGRKILEKKEAEAKEVEKKEEKLKEAEKPVIEGQKLESLFDRYRVVGSYQDISTALRPFGYEFFLEALSKPFTPRKDIPVSSEYIIGPGDEVKILLWGRVNAQYNLIVDRDGNITIPQIGPLHVAGMRFDEMKNYLAEQANQIVGANINVTMGELKSIQVFVLGEIRKPGSYALDSFSTITSAILAAGGPTEIGSLRNIQLKRKNEIVVVMDFYEFLLKGDKSQDRVLQSGDVVFIPTVGPLVGVAGNVKKPAIYELKGKRDLMSLFDMAGGVIPSAYTQQIQVERIQKNERQIVVDVDDKNLTKAKDFMLQDGDLVKVFSIVDKDVNVVFLNGNVKRPGKYEYKPGMRVKDLIKDTIDLLKETYFEYALIKRLKLPGLETQLIPFNLSRLLFNDDAENNIKLEPQDSIYIFSRWFFKDKPFVTVEGEVRKGGRFDLTENMRVRDVILNAGDLTKDAYLQKGEIIRVDNKREYKTIYFNIAKAMVDDPEENLILQDEDKVIIHSIWEEKWKETVSIAGEVKNPKEFVLTESMNVSDLVFKAGGLTRDTYLDEAELYRTDWRTKKVTLQRFNLKKALEGDSLHNINLKDMDKVVVHPIWEQVYKKAVSIDGEVTKPGAYQYTENMTVKDLIFTSGNVLESAYFDEAEVSSFILDESGKSIGVDYKTINLKAALEGDPAHNLPLKPHDRVLIKTIPGWYKTKYITLSGEFKFPGKYIIRKGEKLSSVIERAGGFTDIAYLKGAIFARESVRSFQQKMLDEYIERLERDLLLRSGQETAAALTPEEATIRQEEFKVRKEFINKLRSIKVHGRMVIHIDKPENLKGSESDIELEDGDSLLVFQKPSSINVLGAVYNPTSFLYEPRSNLSHYITKAGGVTENADEKRIYVLKVDGSAIPSDELSGWGIRWNEEDYRWEVGSSKTGLDPGDTIVVPEKLEKIAWLREVKDITQIIFQLAVTAGVVIALF